MVQIRFLHFDVCKLHKICVQIIKKIIKWGYERVSGAVDKTRIAEYWLFFKLGDGHKGLMIFCLLLFGISYSKKVSFKKWVHQALRSCFPTRLLVVWEQDMWRMKCGLSLVKSWTESSQAGCNLIFQSSDDAKLLWSWVSHRDMIVIWAE